LAAFDKRKAEIVEMRFFGGLTVEGNSQCFGRVTGDSGTRLAAGEGMAPARDEREIG